MNHTQRAGMTRPEIEATLGIGRSSGDGPRRRRWFLGALAALLAVGAAYYLIAIGEPTKNLHFRTEPAQTGDITVTVTATGTVQPTNEVAVSSELSGIVRSVAVDYNSHVAVGQVLAELDTDKLNAIVESSRAHLNAAKANVLVAAATVSETETQLRRAQSLASHQVGTVQNLDTARAAYERAVALLASANADVAAAEADLKLNEADLKKTCICSPIDGVVLERNVEPGQVVASSLQAPTLFTIAEDLTKMEVQVDVDEADVGKVREGQKAAFTVDAYPGRSFTATIRELRFGSQVVQGVVTYKAVLTAENPDLLLRPGMTATAEIVVDQVRNAVTVPNEALRFSPPTQDAGGSGGGLFQALLMQRPRFRQASRPPEAGPDRRVWVLKDGEIAPVNVKVGVTDGARTQILEGNLAPGEKVIVDVVSRAS